MADRLSSKARSQLMARIKAEGTKPEMTVRHILHSLGYRYRLHRKDLPGSPDIVFPIRKKAVFVNGCFWHSHRCQKGRIPTTNRSYWSKKLARNAWRDKQTQAKLCKLGWKSFVVWECQIEKTAKWVERLCRFLGASRKRNSNLGTTGSPNQ